MTEALKLVVRGRMPSNDEFRNIFYYTITGDYTDTTISNWVTGLYNTIKGNWLTTTTLYGVDVSVRLGGFSDADPTGWGAADFIAVSLAGTAGSGDTLPPGDAMLVLGKTGTKRVIAKKFLPGILEGSQNNGVITAGQKTLLNNFAAYWMSPTALPTGGTATAAAWGPLHGFSTIVGVRASDYIYHLRRRQFGRGI